MLARTDHITPLFVGSVEVSVDGAVVYLTGLMTNVEDFGARPVVQVVMSDETFRKLLSAGRKKLRMVTN